MLKMVSGCLMSRLAPSFMATASAQSASLLSAPVAVNTPQRAFSVSQAAFRQFQITNNNTFAFDRVVMKNPRPVIVNFFADNEPCRFITGTLKRFLTEYDRIDLVVINVDGNYDFVQRFKLRAVPAIFVFCKGQIIDHYIGQLDANSIRGLLHKIKVLDKPYQIDNELID